MAELDNRAELPEIFPQTDVSVEGEEHTFKVAELDYDTEAQLEYTLDKSPVAEINSIQGADQDGNSRTFSNGVDYELTSRTDTVQDEITFEQDTEQYPLQYQVDVGTETVTDDSGNTYSSSTDYQIITDDDGHYGDIIEWAEGGNSPQDGESVTIVYDTTFPRSVVQWQEDGENLPQAESTFYVTYRAGSIISRYLDAHESELDDVNEALQGVINSKFIDDASEESLDEMAKLFGPTIGKRRGRTDEQYRVYLRSVVQSFISRGTVSGIKLSISAATGVPLDEIEIEEDFTNNTYNVNVTPVVPLTGSIIEEIAEIADPSGVEQLATRFDVADERTSVSDGVDITEGHNILEDAVSDDDVVAVSVEQNAYWGNEWAQDSNDTSLLWTP